jgi:hypothetical protein
MTKTIKIKRGGLGDRPPTSYVGWKKIQRGKEKRREGVLEKKRGGKVCQKRKNAERCARKEKTGKVLFDALKHTMDIDRDALA